MNIQFRLNGKNVQADVEPDVILLDLLRNLGCYSVKRGCETANCGLCTVWLDGKTVLSCSTLAGFRKKRKNSACSWPRRAGSSAGSAARDSS